MLKVANLSSVFSDTCWQALHVDEAVPLQDCSLEDWLLSYQMDHCRMGLTYCCRTNILYLK